MYQLRIFAITTYIRVWQRKSICSQSWYPKKKSHPDFLGHLNETHFFGRSWWISWYLPFQYSTEESRSIFFIALLSSIMYYNVPDLGSQTTVICPWGILKTLKNTSKRESRPSPTKILNVLSIPREYIWVLAYPLQVSGSRGQGHRKSCSRR